MKDLTDRMDSCRAIATVKLPHCRRAHERGRVAFPLNARELIDVAVAVARRCAHPSNVGKAVQTNRDITVLLLILTVPVFAAST